MLMTCIMIIPRNHSEILQTLSMETSQNSKQSLQHLSYNSQPRNSTANIDADIPYEW